MAGCWFSGGAVGLGFAGVLGGAESPAAEFCAAGGYGAGGYGAAG